MRLMLLQHVHKQPRVDYRNLICNFHLEHKDGGKSTLLVSFNMECNVGVCSGANIYVICGERWNMKPRCGKLQHV